MQLPDSSPVQPGLEQTALITGASSGIGYELARLLARDRYNLVLVARSREALEQIATELRTEFGIAVKVIVQDLAVPAAAELIFAQVQQAGWEIELLVNNAGFATYGLFAATALQTELELLQVNIVALTHLSKLLLQPMLARGRGKILNIASTAAFQPGPLMAVYYASKAYVLSFSEAIANEVQGTGVSVTVLCPGPTATGFAKRATVETLKLFNGNNVMDARTVAQMGYQGLMANKTLVIPGLRNRLLATLVRLVPRQIIPGIIRQIQAQHQ